jgi:hypothetical protein
MSRADPVCARRRFGQEVWKNGRMSLSLHVYVCSRCDLRCPASGVPDGVPIYALGDDKVAPLRTRAAWCATCAAVTRAEALPSEHRVEEDIREATEDSRRHADDAEPFLRQMAALNARYVASSDAWRAWAAERRGTGEHCLRCGSEVPVLEVLEGDAAWPLRFAHPHCAGIVSMIEGDLSVAWADADLETVEYGCDGRRSALSELNSNSPTDTR